MHYAWMVNENGGTSNLITMNNAVHTKSIKKNSKIGKRYKILKYAANYDNDVERLIIPNKKYYFYVEQNRV
jgi:hypothetical protein